MLRNILGLVLAGVVVAGNGAVASVAMANHTRSVAAAAVGFGDYAHMLEDEIASHFGHAPYVDNLVADAAALHEDADRLANAALAGESEIRLRLYATRLERRFGNLSRMLEFVARDARGGDCHVKEIVHEMSGLMNTVRSGLSLGGCSVVTRPTPHHDHRPIGTVPSFFVPGSVPVSPYGIPDVRPGSGYGIPDVRPSVRPGSVPVVPFGVPGSVRGPVVPSHSFGGFSARPGVEVGRPTITFRLGR